MALITPAVRGEVIARVYYAIAAPSSPCGQDNSIDHDAPETLSIIVTVYIISNELIMTCVLAIAAMNEAMPQSGTHGE